MTATTIRVQMAQRKDTAANWTSANPILLSGEIGYETDTKKFKIGNGSTNWNSLAYLPIPDGSGNLTITGNLEIGSTGSLTFEGSTADGFETTLAVTNPTADRTITLPDRSGTVITSGDTGTVTSTMLADGTIVNDDVNVAAAIAGTKISPDFGSQTVQTTGIFSHALGSAAAPTVTFTGDNNTGIYSPGPGQVAISTGGSGRLFVDASGNVGVGTGGTQGTKLHAVGGNIWSGNFYEVGRFQKSSGTAISLGYDNSDYVATVGAYSHDGTPSNLSFWTYPGSGAVQERLRITSAGLVGIGTSSPGALLDLAGGAIRLNSTHGIYKANADGYAYFSGGTGLTAGGTIFCFGESHAGNANEIHFRNSSNLTRAVIDSSGRVGIGTTSPGVLLDLSSATAASRLTSTTGTNPSYVNFVNTAGNAYIGIESSTGGGAAVGNAPYALHLSHQGAYPINFSTNNALRATIDSSGRLLVGTSSDSGGALLQVNGDRIRVGTAKTPASATATGTAGEICWDASYVYVCTATNTWKRSALSTW